MENTEPIAEAAEATAEAIEKLKEAKDAVKRLTRVRAQNKLSFNRAANVARELEDLIRVMTVYTREHVSAKL